MVLFFLVMMEVFCGVYCFGYFQGVVIIVIKLFIIVCFDVVYFGVKDV